MHNNLAIILIPKLCIRIQPTDRLRQGRILNDANDRVGPRRSRPSRLRRAGDPAVIERVIEMANQVKNETGLRNARETARRLGEANSTVRKILKNEGQKKRVLIYHQAV